MKRSFARARLAIVVGGVVVAPHLVLAQSTEESLVQELFAVYQDRCITEVKVLAAELDKRNAAVLAKMPTAPQQSVMEAVRVSWSLKDEAIRLYRQLEDSPRKFTRWAKEEKLPAWFSVPDSVIQVRRWEGLRSVLAPVASGERLGWNLEDTHDWKVKPGAWRLELLLLLRWFGSDLPRLDAETMSQALTWTSEQSARAYVAAWRDSPAKSYRLLHASYSYTLLKLPNVNGALPARVSLMIDHVAWSGAGDLPSFLSEKETLLADLIAELAGEQRGNQASAGWFDASARTFPPLVAFDPVWVDSERRILAMRRRKDSPLARMLDAIQQEKVDAGTRQSIASAVLWYQTKLTPSGELIPPVAGWSSWVPSAPVVPVPKDRGAIATHGPVYGPQGIWRQMCIWTCTRLAGRDNRQPIKFTIHQPLTWTFAFREDELKEIAEELQLPLKFEGPQNSPTALPVVLKITGVKQDQWIEVVLRINGKDEDPHRFEIPGPWPPWVATRTLPDPGKLWLWLALGLFCFALWWMLQSPALRRSRWLRRLAISALCLGPWLTFVMILSGPQPVPAPELGGIVELVLPLHAGTPPALRDVVTRISDSVYDRLAHLTLDEQRPVLAMSLKDRYLYVIRRVGGAKRERRAKPVKSSLTQLEYRIAAAVWPSRAEIVGPINQSRIPEFHRLVESLAYQSEPDLPRSLVYGPQPGTRVVLNLSDGDHGAIRRPSMSTWKLEDGTVLSVFLTTPARDFRNEHSVKLATRYQWTRDRSTVIRCLLRGCPDALRSALPSLDQDPDGFANEPTDLDSVRQQSWSFANQQPEIVQAAAEEVADDVVRLVRRTDAPTQPGSHTILQVTDSWWRSMWLWLPLLIGIPYWLQTPGLLWGRWHKLFGLLVASAFVPLVFLLGFIPAIGSLLSENAWTYGDGLLDAVVDPLRCAAVALVLMAVVKLGWLGGEAWNANEFWRRMAKVNPKPDSSFWIWLVRSCGFPIAGMAIAFWAAAPVRDAGGYAWLPVGYTESLMAAMTFWSAGILLLFCQAKPSPIPQGGK